MRKLFYTLVFILLLFNSCELTNTRSNFSCKSSWFNVYGTAERELVNSFCASNDGGYIVSGSTDNENTNLLYLVKTDCNGSVLWENIYTEALQGNAIKPVQNGGYIIYGNNNTYDLVLIRINEDGEILWSKNYSQTSHNYGIDHCLEVCSDNGFIFSGRTIVNGNDEIIIIKTDSQGNEQWRTLIGGAFDYRSSAIVEVSDGYFIAAQKRERPWHDFEAEFYLIRLSAQGDTAWTKNYKAEITEYLEDILITRTKDIYLLGTEGVGGNVYFPKMVLKKIDYIGNELWTKKYYSDLLSTHSGAIAQALVQDISGNLLLLGNTNGEQDILIIKTDLEGNELTKKFYGGTNFFIRGDTLIYSGNDFGNDLLLTFNGCIITGFTSNYGAGSADIFLFKLNDDLEGEYKIDSLSSI